MERPNIVYRCLKAGFAARAGSPLRASPRDRRAQGGSAAFASMLSRTRPELIYADVDVVSEHRAFEARDPERRVLALGAE